MEHFYKSVWLLTPLYLAWILTLTSPSKATSQGLLTSSSSNDSQWTLTSLQSRPPLAGGDQRGDECCRGGCCLNGGVCFPSSDFCRCPKEFYGYRCENRRKRGCGPVKHLQLARIGCNRCRCFDSHLWCVPYVYSGCDGEPPKEEVDINDYLDDMEIFPMNKVSSNTIDNYYSSSNTDIDMKENNSSDNTGSGNNAKAPSQTISSGNSYNDIYYYNYSDYEDEEYNDNISNRSNPFSKIRTWTYYWTFFLCLVTCLINWIVDVNTDIYFIS